MGLKRGVASRKAVCEITLADTELQFARSLPWWAHAHYSTSPHVTGFTCAYFRSSYIRLDAMSRLTHQRRRQGAYAKECHRRPSEPFTASIGTYMIHLLQRFPYGVLRMYFTSLHRLQTTIRSLGSGLLVTQCSRLCARVCGHAFILDKPWKWTGRTTYPTVVSFNFHWLSWNTIH